MQPIIIIIAVPIAARPDYFEARVADWVLCAATRIPFLDGARRLIELGHDPRATIVLRAPASSTDRLRSTIGAAARLTVAEGDADPPRFRRWKGPQSREGSPRTAEFGSADSPHLALVGAAWSIRP
jgi:hypothetical protein